MNKTKCKHVKEKHIVPKFIISLLQTKVKRK